MMLIRLLILNKEFIKMHNFDVYMAPLIEELHDLWKGVPTYHVGQIVEQRQFTLKTILVSTIHDYLAYGLVSGFVRQGYKACATCGLDITF
jgi:hypothetical protein